MTPPHGNHRHARRQHTDRRRRPPHRGPQKMPFIPKPGHNEVRIIVLGGVSELGKNMYAIECNDTIVILDCGAMSGESTTPGVDLIIPNIEYLKSRKHALQALVLSDASLQHTGALASVITELGPLPIYARKLTGAVIENRLRQLRRAPALNLNDIEENKTVTLNDTVSLHFFGIGNATPTTLGVIVETVSGSIAYTGPLCPEQKDTAVLAKEDSRFAPLQNTKLTLCLADSANAERAGFSLTDKEIANDVINSIKQASGRVLAPLIHSQVKRNCLILEGVLGNGRDIYVEDSLLLDNLLTACDLGITDIPKKQIKSFQELDTSSDMSNVVLFFCGDEGEDYPSLNRVSFAMHRRIHAGNSDSVIFPSPIIQANARVVQDVKDRLSRLGASILSYTTSDIRGSSHPSKDELRWLHQKSNATFFIPVQGYHYMLTAHSHIVRDCNRSRDTTIIPNNGSLVDISPNGTSMKLQKRKAPSTSVSADGNTPSVVQEVVIQDRQTLSKEGVFIVIVFLDQRRMRLKKSPDIISRGFVYLRESKDLVSHARILVKKVTEREAKKSSRISIDMMKKAIQKELQSFLLGETNKRPIIIPVIFM